MSEHHDNAPTGLFSYFKQSPVVGIISLVTGIVVIITVVAYLTAPNTNSSNASFTAEAVAERIQKVGTVEVGDANRPARSGEDVFKAQCTTCHTSGAAGAPKFADAGAWGARLKVGYEGLLNSALKGKGSMGAQGGGEFSDFEIGRAVVYMANAAGGKLAEPKKPEEKK